MQLTKYPIENKDQLGNKHSFSTAPKRIISTVPSITYTLIELGLKSNIVGRTKFCIHPSNIVKNIPKIGGTKTLAIERIKEIKPDLIIANKEENELSQISQLQKLFPVWISDVNNLSENNMLLENIGHITNTHEKAQNIVNQIKKEFSTLKTVKNTSTAYLIWNNPIMVASKNTFINSILTEIGFKNIFEAGYERYPKVELEEIKERNPDFIFLSSEPYPFKQKHIKAFSKHLTKAKLVLVDGEMFSWFGSKMQYAPKYFNQLLLENCYK